MTTTKKQSKTCRVPKGKPPTKAEYNRLSRWLVSHTSKAELASADADDLPVPHLMPPYGGECWNQCYREALAYKKACQDRATWLASKYAYTVAWDATEACKSGYPA
jgi:hypothetical protein